MAKDKTNNKNKKEADKKVSIKVETIPKAFYGGKTPVILEKPKSRKIKKIDTNKKVEKITKKQDKSKQINKPISNVPTSIPQDKINLGVTPIKQPNKPVNPVKFVNNTQQKISQPKKSNKGFIIGIIILFILGLGAIAYYFIYLAPPVKNQAVDVSDVTKNNDLEIINTSTQNIDDIQAQDINTTTQELDNNLKDTSADSLSANKPFEITFPETLVSFAADLDQDGLYDNEETIFQTDPGIIDSDQDGYSDLREVENLYNPTGFAPVKIIDSGLVQEYLNPTWKYRLYFPSTWQAGEVDEIADQVIFSTVDNQYIEVSTSKKLESESFFSWFGRVANSQNITELAKSKNRFDQEVYIRKDGLVSYIDTPEAVYLIIYKNELQEPVQYKNIVMLLTQSFRVNKVVKVQDSIVSTTIPIISTTTTSTQNTTNTTTTTSTTNQEN